MLNRASAILALSLAAMSGQRHVETRRADATRFDLVIAATTDTHGRVRGWNYETNRADPARGLTRAATIVDSLRTAAPGRVVLLDAGDLLQGNSFTYVAARVA